MKEARPGQLTLDDFSPIDQKEESYSALASN